MAVLPRRIKVVMAQSMEILEYKFFALLLSYSFIKSVYVVVCYRIHCQGPGCQDERFYFALVRTPQYPEVAVFSPLSTPTVCHFLQAQKKTMQLAKSWKIEKLKRLPDTKPSY